MKRALWIALAALPALLPLPVECATIAVYISAPTTQTTFVSGASTETFNSLTNGLRTTNYTSPLVGGDNATYQLTTTSAFMIQNADQYGGASGSKYMTFGAQSNTSGAITVKFNAQYNYFGFWWSAGDANNGVSFYLGTTFLGRFSTADIMTVLSPSTGTVKAINGTVYNNSQYYGNPNGSNQNTGEPYAYVSIVTNGITFDKIIMDNSGTTGTGFESDNHSVYNGQVVVPGTAVVVKSVPPVAPEPGTAVMMALGVGLLLAGRRALRGRVR
jgi:hypothetical protein